MAFPSRVPHRIPPCSPPGHRNHGATTVDPAQQSPREGQGQNGEDHDRGTNNPAVPSLHSPGAATTRATESFALSRGIGSAAESGGESRQGAWSAACPIATSMSPDPCRDRSEEGGGRGERLGAEAVAGAAPANACGTGPAVPPDGVHVEMVTPTTLCYSSVMMPCASSEAIIAPRGTVLDEERADSAVRVGCSLEVVFDGAMPETSLAGDGGGRIETKAHEALVVDQKQQQQQQQRQEEVVDADSGALQIGVNQEQDVRHREQQRRYCKQHRQATTEPPRAGSTAACSGGGSVNLSHVSSRSDACGSGVAARVGSPADTSTAVATATAAAESSPAEQVRRGEVADRVVVPSPTAAAAAVATATATATAATAAPAAEAEAAAEATVAARTGPRTTEATTGTGTSISEASSVWDIDPLDFEDDHDGGEDEEEANGGGVHGPEPELRGSERREEDDQRCVAQSNKEAKNADDGVDSHGGGGVEQRPPQPQEDSCDSDDDGDISSEAGRRVGRRGGGAAAVATAAAVVVSTRARELMPPPPPNVTRANMRRRRSRVSLMHSPRSAERKGGGGGYVC